MASFNVLMEPWIPATRKCGGVKEYGLLDLLEQAHDLTGVVDPAPPIQFGLYRLLIAFVTAALRLEEFEDIKARLRDQRFDRAELEHYARSVGWDRFDLFHDTHPFLQSTPMPDDADREKSVAFLFFHLPTGTNVTFFFHRNEETHAISPAACARGLTAIAPFMTAGGSGYSPSINGTPPWYVLIRRESLFETLLFNCFPTHDHLEGDEPPAWASDTPLVPKHEKHCDSLLEGLTWRARQVRLIPGDGGICSYTGQPSDLLVRRIIFGPGFKFAGTDGWFDPQVAYRTTDKGTFPLRPEEDRALWRDSGPLLLLRRHEYKSVDGKLEYSRPRIMEQLQRLKASGGNPAAMDCIEAYGMRADKSKVFEWRYERLAVPAGVLANPAAGPQVQDALELAERLADEMGLAIKQAYPRAGAGNHKALDRTINTATTMYWERLERYFRSDFLTRLASQDPNDLAARTNLLDDWKQEIRKAGWSSFDRAVDPLVHSDTTFPRYAKADGYFARAVSDCLFPKPRGEKVPQGRKGKR